MVTDEKSVYDNLQKTGSVPRERRTVIDLLVIKDLVENSVVKVRRVPTTHMLADILTKEIAMTELFENLGVKVCIHGFKHRKKRQWTDTSNISVNSRHIDRE